MKRYGYLGNYLKRCREEQGLSQSKISDALKLTSPQSISNWERGITKPTHEQLPVLFKVLKMDYDQVKKAFTKDFHSNFDQMVKQVRKVS